MGWDTWGGAREGAGRPSIGEPKTIKLTLTKEQWEWLDGQYKSRSEIIRTLIAQQMKPGQVDIYEAIKRAQEVGKR